MKTLFFKIVSVGILFNLFTFISSGQTLFATNDDGEKAYPEIDIKSVPAEVAVKFAEDYPVTSYENWYGYPTFTNESDWYSYDPKFYSDKYPEFFIVEFMQNNSPHKAIFYLNGDRIASYRRLNSDSPEILPEKVSNAINNSEYKTWNIVIESEEIILRDSNQMKVYRIEIQNGNDKHLLYYTIEGILLKDLNV